MLFLGFQSQAVSGHPLNQDGTLCPDFDLSSPQESQIYHEVVFGESITFHFCWHNEPEVESATINIEIENFEEPLAGTVSAPKDAGSGDLINLNHQINLAQTLIPPFSTIRYTWTLQYKTEPLEIYPIKTFEYSDSRIDWQKVERDDATTDEVVRVYSEAQHESLANTAWDIINKSLPEIKQVIPAGTQELTSAPIDIYLYPDNQTFQSALRLTGLDWVAGKASPEIGVIMLPISSSSDQAIAITELEQRIPHELSHLLIYRATGDGYRNLPSWIDEGLATTFEAVPNPNYAFSLESVTDSTQLIPFSEMCVNLPIQPPDMALRGYAQSHSIVKYILAEYGPDTMRSIITAAADGAQCEQAVQQGLGNNTTQNELVQEWLTSLQPDQLEPGSPLRVGLVGLLLILGLFILMSIILWTRTYSSRTFSEFNG